MASARQLETVEIADEQLANTVVEDSAGLGVRRFFTIPGRDPFDEIEWETRDALIPGKDGPAFEQKDVEFPKFWSQTATNIVAQKYFRGRMSSPERETSVRQMIGRVVDTIGGWGREGSYFADEDEAETFEAELKAILVNQYAAFNSPVWFNVGFEEKPQCSACFILSIDDSMESILDWIRREGIIFRGGSGSGVNLSQPALLEGAALQGRVRQRPGQLHARRRRERRHDQVRRQDAARGQDGRARRRPPGHRAVHLVQGARGGEGARRSSRSATTCRSTPTTGPRSSTRTPTTRSASPTPSWRPPRQDADWNLIARTDGAVVDTIKAKELLRQIAEASWKSADPGVQYDTTINKWHTLPNTGRINASNPCSEYMSIDDSACNLASLNLLKFRREDGELDVEAFEHAVDVVFLAQEIAVGYSSYPTPEIEQEREGLPPARPGLREPRRAADGARAPVRLGRGPRLRSRDHGADDRPRLPQVGGDRRAAWARSPATGRTPAR